MPPSPAWARRPSTASSAGPNAPRRRSTGERAFREHTGVTSDSEDDGLSYATRRRTLSRTSSISHTSTRQGQPHQQADIARTDLKEARLQSKNNLQEAWNSIFDRYTRGDHLARGRDDVFDFGTGEVIEDAGFLDDFIVNDEELEDAQDEQYELYERKKVFFQGRSIEIGDFGLPGAMGMQEVSESDSSSSSSSDEETEVITRSPSRSSHDPRDSSDSGSDKEGGAKRGTILSKSTSHLITDTQPRSVKRERRTPFIARRSASMPDSVDLLSSSSSEDELAEWSSQAKNVAPVSETYKHKKQLRSHLMEDLQEFMERESVRDARETVEKVKRERTCTPAMARMTPRASSSRPPMHFMRRTPSTAPSSFASPSTSRSSQPFERSRQMASPVKSIRINTPVTPSMIKPESSSSYFPSSMSMPDMRQSRAPSSRPSSSQSFSLAASKPSSAKALISGSYATSAIPLGGHYSNTLLSQAIACENDSSDDDFALTPSKSAGRAKTEIGDDSVNGRIPWSAKGKGRVKEETPVTGLRTYTGQVSSTTSHLPSPPLSRSVTPRKRSPSFFATPMSSRLPPSPSKRLTPVVEIIKKARPRSMQPPAAALSRQPHTVPRAAAVDRHGQYRPKQSSPLKDCSQYSSVGGTQGAFSTHRKDRAPSIVSVPSDSEEDSDGDIPLSMLPSPSANRPSHQPSRSQAAKQSPQKRKYSTSPEPHSGFWPGNHIFPTPPRSFSSTQDDGIDLPASASFRHDTPTKPLSNMQLSTASGAKTAYHLLSSPQPSLSPSPRKMPRRFSLSPARLPTSIGGSQKQVPYVPLPTPPLSAGSTVSSNAEAVFGNANSGAILTMEDGDVFKVPSPPRRLIARAEAIQKSTPVHETADKFSSDSEDDEILLVSPERPVHTKTVRATPSPIGAGFLRSDTRIRYSSAALSRNVGRASSILASRARSQSVKPALPPPDDDGSESDDPLGI